MEEERCKNGGSTKFSVGRPGKEEPLVEWRKEGPSLWRWEAHNIKQPAWWGSALKNIREDVSFLLAFKPLQTALDEEVWEEFTTRQGGAKGCRRRRMCERESLVYLIVNVVVFFFCVIRVGVQCLERCLWT